eukprot:365358-Chlamydomonas_euryale.AAC.9
MCISKKATSDATLSCSRLLTRAQQRATKRSAAGLAPADGAPHTFHAFHTRVHAPPPAPGATRAPARCCHGQL